MKSHYRLGLAVLSLLTGLTFVVSFYTKLYPVELFEIKLVESGIAGWTTAPIVARFILGVELFVGIVFILNIQPGRWFYFFSIGLLTFFSIYLLIEILLKGNAGDCGCFNNFIPMTPLEAIVKNAILTGMIVLLYRFYDGLKFRYTKPLIGFLVVIAFSATFILNPVALAGTPETVGENDVLPLEPLYSGSKDSIPSADLRKGKWIVAYLSLTCPHCKTSAYKMQVMKNKNPQLPIYFFLNGKEQYLKKFIEDTHLKTIPYMRLKGRQFILMSGTSLPAIYLIEDQKIYKKPDYVQLDQQELEQWLNHQ